MVAQTIELREGQYENYSVLAFDDNYAIVNWWVTAGSAKLNEDFKVSFLSGSGVKVTEASPLIISFSIIDDLISEDREFFKFHVDVTAYDKNGQVLGDQSSNTEYTIEIVDNDTGCFIDLDRDNVKGPVDLTFEEANRLVTKTKNRLEYTESLLSLANEKLESQQGEASDLKALLYTSVAGAIVSVASAGLSELGRVFGNELPKLIDALDTANQIYDYSQSEDELIAFVQSAMLLARTLVGVTPGLATTNLLLEGKRIQNDVERNRIATEDLLGRIGATKDDIQYLNQQYTTLSSDLAKLQACLNENPVVPLTPASLAPQSLAAFQPTFDITTNGSTTTWYGYSDEYEVGLALKLIKGTDSEDTLTFSDLPSLNPTHGVIVAAGGGDDLINFTPDFSLGYSIAVVSGGDGFDTLRVHKPFADFAEYSTPDGVVTIAPFTTRTVNIFLGEGVPSGSRQEAVQGTQLLLYSVERVVFDGGSMILTGSAFSDALYGGDQDDVLNGSLGADTMQGGRGNDVYYVDNPGDKVIELKGEGTDTVRSFTSFNMGGSWIERLELMDIANINGVGNSVDNTIIGNIGRNVIDGGRGEDFMQGGGGNDRYYVDNVNDKVIEAKNGGTDHVVSTVSFSLAGQYIEWLTLTGSANINGTGNSLDNKITGNSVRNVIDGGKGADTMAGKDGNDRYYVDNHNDKVIEAKNEGTDHVVSTVSFSLAGQHIEWLTLTGAAQINGTGNSLDNKITGNDGRNIIDGGRGADTMAGKDGNDRYYVDNRNDEVIEAKNEGTDHVVSTVSFSLAGQYIEWLTLSGTGNINAGGNSLDNKLTGNGGNNTLNGGKGNDILTGGGGVDFFKFDAALGANNVDTITDFQVNVDKILLDGAIFAAVGTSLTASEFVASATGAATTDAQHILYNTSNGRLYFDADGSGAQERMHFATLSAGLALDHLDFLVI